jgi:hypothetical protein
MPEFIKLIYCLINLKYVKVIQYTPVEAEIVFASSGIDQHFKFLKPDPNYELIKKYVDQIQ